MGFVLVVVLGFGGFVGVDYLRYKNGSRSLYFGTLDSYSQGQILRFDALDVRVTQTVGETYSPPSSYEIASHNAFKQECEKEPAYITDSTGKYVKNPASPWACSFTFGGDSVDRYNDFFQYEKNIKVEFSYQNTSDKPLNIGGYSFTLAANTVQRNNSKCDMQNGNLLAGPPVYGCVYTDIDKNYNGPLSLLVQHDWKTKSITVAVPKVTGSLNQY